MAIIKINNQDIVISISEDDYIGHNKEYIDEAIEYFIDNKELKGRFEYCKESDTERENPIPIEWETLRKKEQLIEDLESIISEINIRIDNLAHDYSKSSSMSRIVDKLELAISEINERFVDINYSSELKSSQEESLYQNIIKQNHLYSQYEESPLNKIIEQYENSLGNKEIRAEDMEDYKKTQEENETNIDIDEIKKYSDFIKKVGISVNEYILILKEINKHEEDNLEYDIDTPIEEFSELTYENILELMEEDGFNSNIVQEVMYNRNGADVKEWQKVEDLKETLHQIVQQKPQEEQKTTQEETETQKSKPNRQR